MDVFKACVFVHTSTATLLILVVLFIQLTKAYLLVLTLAVLVLLPTADHPQHQNLERNTGLEPVTSTLAKLHSTTELIPQLSGAQDRNRTCTTEVTSV